MTNKDQMMPVIIVRLRKLFDQANDKWIFQMVMEVQQDIHTGRALFAHAEQGLLRVRQVLRILISGLVRRLQNTVARHCVNHPSGDRPLKDWFIESHTAAFDQVNCALLLMGLNTDYRLG